MVALGFLPQNFERLREFMNSYLSFYECTFSDGYTQTLSAAIELFEVFAVTGCTKTSSLCSLMPSSLLPPKSNLGRGRSRIPVGRGANLPGEPTYKFARFSQNCMKLRKFWSGVGEGLGEACRGYSLGPATACETFAMEIFTKLANFVF